MLPRTQTTRFPTTTRTRFRMVSRRHRKRASRWPNRLLLHIAHHGMLQTRSIRPKKHLRKSQPLRHFLRLSVGTAESMDAAFQVPSGSDGRIVLGVAGPEPVDPYIVGKKLGFDSMPQPKKRHKGMIDPKGWPERGVDVSQSNMPALSQEPAGSQVVCAGGSSSQNATDAAYSRGIAENADAGAEASDRRWCCGARCNGHGVALLRERRVPQHPPWGTGAESADTVAAASFGAVPAATKIRSPHVPCLQESELKNLTSRRFLQAASRTATKWTSLTYSARSAFRSTACRRSNSIYYSSSRASGAFGLFGMIGFRSAACCALR